MEPTRGGSITGAIAISYTNADLAKIIRTAAFSGKSLSLVIYPDGRIALSTKEGGGVFSNYLTYLRAGSNLSDNQLDQMHLDWEDGEKGAIVCKLGDEDYSSPICLSATGTLGAFVGGTSEGSLSGSRVLPDE